MGKSHCASDWPKPRLFLGRKVVGGANSVVSEKRSGARRRRRGPFFLIAILAVLSSAGVALPAPGDSGGSLEYRVKAAFIFNFTKFVQWPADSFEDDNTPLILGIIGNDPFGSILEETFEERTAQGRKIVVERFDGIERASDCHLLFISDSQAKRLQHVFSKLDDLPILTIAEMEFFAQDGGIIGFYIRKNKVKFEINPEAAKSKGLKISSKLLNLARIVQSNQGG